MGNKTFIETLGACIAACSICIGASSAIVIPSNRDYLEMRLYEVEDRLSQVSKRYSCTGKEEVIEEDVMGNSEPEKFYLLNNQRVYLEIDGQPIEKFLENYKKSEKD